MSVATSNYRVYEDRTRFAYNFVRNWQATNHTDYIREDEPVGEIKSKDTKVQKNAGRNDDN